MTSVVSSHLILRLYSPAVSEEPLGFRLCAGAETWSLAVPLLNPRPDSNDPLNGSPLHWIQLFWFWSVPKVIAYQIHKRAGKKSSQFVTGWRNSANLTWLWYQEAITWPHGGHGFPGKAVREKTGLWKMYLQSDSDDPWWEKENWGEKVNVWTRNYVCKIYTLCNPFGFLESIKWAFLR